MKIIVIGFSGSGKSIFSARLASHYNIPVIHLDTIFWLPGWKKKDDLQMSEDIKQIVKENESFVMDGNFFRYYHERFDEADQIFILKLNRFVCFDSACRRAREYRGKKRSSITEGCKERMNPSFIHWILIGGRRKKRLKKYTDVETKYSDKVTVFKTRDEVNSYLKQLEG